MIRSISLLPLFLLLFAPRTIAQDPSISGVITDNEGNPVPQASVSIASLQLITYSGSDGSYELQVPADTKLEVRVGHVAFADMKRTLTLSSGENLVWNVSLKVRDIGPGAEVLGTRNRDPGVSALDPKVTRFVPSPLGNVESLLIGEIGVSIRNELSSGYSVRGGNFDENLVYVNDIEVYRPFLARTGQQEGLSFPNPDMIERIEFSAGGFDAKYGDKMSSVLDIQYKRPKEFASSFTASLLGGAVHFENPMLNRRLRQVTGIRYQRNTYLLDGLDTQGEYDPRYVDVQSYWTYDLSDKVELGVLGLYSRNSYSLIPQDRQTELGNFNEALRFTVFFDGQELSQYETGFGALSTTIKANPDLLLKFTLSGFKTYEEEKFDVQGEYLLQELERDLGSDEFGQAVQDLGIGSWLDHARNRLEATVLTFNHKGYLQLPNSYLQWGATVRSEVIEDKLSEWTLIDSADFSIPQGTNSDLLELSYNLKARLNAESVRSSAYVQNDWDWENGEHGSVQLTAGVRAQHWSFNNETVISPRVRVSMDPGWGKLLPDSTFQKKEYKFWFATGFYYQPPFYRELRGLDGVLNPDIRAQRSIHFVLGMHRFFKIWERPFKFTTEAYYKQLDNLIPYEVDNVRIRYYGDNLSSGYATGIDLKLNGEFIEGIQSWMSLSVLSIQEDLENDSFTERYNAAGELIVPGFTFDQVVVDSATFYPGNIPRPTDQRVSFAMFFQDEMPNWPTFKVHLSLVFGTGLPFGPPDYERYKDVLRTSLYRRVDVGFSKQLLGAPGQEKEGALGKVKDMWLSLELFNLLDIQNTVSYTWVQDVRGRYYAIPDRLTPRRVNLKLIARF